MNQNQHMLKFMRVLCSLYSEDVQFADFLKFFHNAPTAVWVFPSDMACTQITTIADLAILTLFSFILPALGAR